MKPRLLASLLVGALCISACSGSSPQSSSATPALGSVGPGGGLVFYVSAEPFACGPALESECTYLEVSPADADYRLAWTSGSRETYPENNWARPVPGADDPSIGAGYQNTLDILAMGGNEPDTSAAAFAGSYVHGGKDDWFLPSADELNELCKFARYDADNDPSIRCSRTGPLRPGFAPSHYWSSTEHSDTAALQQYFYHLKFDKTGEFLHPGNFKNKTLRARPVRAG